MLYKRIGHNAQSFNFPDHCHRGGLLVVAIGTQSHHNGDNGAAAATKWIAETVSIAFIECIRKKDEYGYNKREGILWTVQKITRTQVV